MVLRITNNCNFSCIHCMQNSDPNKKDFMEIATFINAINFVNESVETKKIMISGGEPTQHPDFLLFIELIANYGRLTNVKDVYILTNGQFMFTNPELFNKLVKIIIDTEYVNIHLQVTSVKGIYSNYISQADVDKVIRDNFSTDDRMLLLERIKLVTNFENGIISVGKAKNNIEQIKKFSYIYPSKAPKCYNLYSMIVNLGLRNIIDIIDAVKANTKYSNCVPLIKENGDLSFGEFDVCTKEYNINSANRELNIKEINGPCGECYSNPNMEIRGNAIKHYLKLLNNKI